MKRLIALFLFSILIPTSSFAWNEVECSSINKNLDLLNSNYSPQRCWSSISGSVRAFAGDYEDNQNYIWFEVQEITVGNSRWGSNYAFDNLKKDKVIDIISMYNLGNNPSIDNKASKLKSSNGKLLYYHKNFETSDGKGVVGGNTMDKLFYEFGFFTVDKSANLNEDFISELLSSLKILWANKGVQTSVKLSSNSDSSLSTQEITDALVEQGTGNYGEDVTITIPNNNESLTGQRTFMLSWENVGVMQGTLSFDEQERTGRIDFKLPNDNSTCFGTYALSEAKGSWSFLCSNDSSATGSLKWNPSDNSIVGNGKDNKNNAVQVMVAGS